MLIRIFILKAIDNKRFLRGSKNPSRMSLKMYLMNRPASFSVTFLVAISEETGGWLLLKRV